MILHEIFPHGKLRVSTPILYYSLDYLSQIISLNRSIASTASHIVDRHEIGRDYTKTGKLITRKSPDSLTIMQNSVFSIKAKGYQLTE